MLFIDWKFDSFDGVMNERKRGMGWGIFGGTTFRTLAETDFWASVWENPQESNKNRD